MNKIVLTNKNILKGNLISTYVSTSKWIMQTMYNASFFKQNVSSIILPHLDFEKRLNNISELNRSLKERGLSIDIHEIIQLWKEYKLLKEKKACLEINKQLISGQIKELTKQESSRNKYKIERLKILGKLTREDLKSLAVTYSSIEENVVSKILKLPNDFDSVPFDAEIKKKSFNISLKTRLHHLEFSKTSNIINYTNPFTYYLRKTAALFELAATSYFSKELIKHGFILFSNPDFSKNLILEGFSSKEDNLDIISLHKISNELEMLHLTGGASLFPFLGYHAKQSVEMKDLPVKYVVKGRKYTRRSRNLMDLYSVWQSSAVQIFVGSTEEKVSTEFNDLVSLATSFYESFNVPFRVTYTPTKGLKLSEKLRVSFQVYSPFYQTYIETGNLSLYGDFISKRLRIYYLDGDHIEFLHLISGTIVEVPALLACVLECGAGKTIFPGLIKIFGNDGQCN